MNISTMERRFLDWLAALEARHLANLRVSEVTKALRALSSAYVERRRHPAAQTDGRQVLGALDSAGKRAAFALFYAPLHFIAVTEVVRARNGTTPPPKTIIDLGCGTGAAGAAWALAAQPDPVVVGIDRHPWAVEETQWTYRQLGVRGRARQGDIVKLLHPRRDEAIVAAYVLNELPEAARARIEDRLFETATRGGRLLVIEPIARTVAPWWDDFAARFARAGGRSEEWRVPIHLPPLLEKFDRAAGLNHRELTFRSLWVQTK
jgi:methylase of polypeptide subunit release factors